jgi:hypothetical protein
LRHDRATEAWVQASSDRSTLAAFLTDETDNVQVSVYRPAPAGEVEIWVRALTQGEHQYVTKTPGNLSVTYPTLDPDEPQVFPSFAPRVLRALALLRQARSGKRHSAHRESARYWQGTDSTGATSCVAYDREGAGGSVREGICPKH